MAKRNKIKKTPTKKPSKIRERFNSAADKAAFLRSHPKFAKEHPRLVERYGKKKQVIKNQPKKTAKPSKPSPKKETKIKDKVKTATPPKKAAKKKEVITKDGKTDIRKKFDASKDKAKFLKNHSKFAKEHPRLVKRHGKKEEVAETKAPETPSTPATKSEAPVTKVKTGGLQPTEEQQKKAAETIFPGQNESLQSKVDPASTEEVKNILGITGAPEGGASPFERLYAGQDITSDPTSTAYQTALPGFRPFTEAGVEDSAIYQQQLKRGSEDLSEYLAAKGLQDSGAEIESQQDLIGQLRAQEAARVAETMRQDADRYVNLRQGDQRTAGDMAGLFTGLKGTSSGIAGQLARGDADRYQRMAEDATRFQERRDDAQWGRYTDIADIQLAQNPMNYAYQGAGAYGDATLGQGKSGAQAIGSNYQTGYSSPGAPPPTAPAPYSAPFPNQPNYGPANILGGSQTQPGIGSSIGGSIKPIVDIGTQLWDWYK